MKQKGYVQFFCVYELLLFCNQRVAIAFYLLYSSKKTILRAEQGLKILF